MKKTFIIEVDMSSQFNASLLQLGLIGMLINVISVKEIKKQEDKKNDQKT